ncbi:MAG: glycosyltransferase family 4 protein [Bacteroidia bacterium]|nr:glycosyltransferase family 4 protein [Bacteroidia bacterium]
MKLGYYYHVPIKLNKNNKIALPSYLVGFINELANHVDTLYLIAHEASVFETQELDGEVSASNIKWVNLGSKTPAWHRVLFHHRILNKIIAELGEIDQLIVRAPSPLAPYFSKFISTERLSYLVVGDYGESANQFIVKSFRDFVITYFLKFQDWKLKQEVKKTLTIVNSRSLYDKYKNHSYILHETRTTTLNNTDFVEIKDGDIKKHEPVRIIYTGRIDLTKGLKELIEAVKELNQRGIKSELAIVGWELNPGDKIRKELDDFACKLGVSEKVNYPGKKGIGTELNACYRSASIYCIPSYNEGFPRTIWEAMANGLPVIATKVGGIPAILKDEENSILINPKSVSEITDAISKLYYDSKLYNKIRMNGQILASTNTIEIQTKKIIDLIKYRM